MQTPFQVTFRSIAHSDALATHLRERAEKLDHLFDRIVSCHAVIELDGHRHRQGDHYRVTINVGLPGHELVVTHAPQDRSLENPYVAADRAFDEAERQLEDWVRRRRDVRREPRVYES